MAVARSSRPFTSSMFALLALTPLHALAQTGTRTATEPSPERMAARRQLIADASTAQAQGRHAEALALAQRAGEIQMTPSLQTMIAQEQKELGQFAAALGSAELCVRDAERDTTLRQRDAILATCRTLLESIRARVGLLTVRISESAPAGLLVKIGNDTLSPDLYGLPYPIVGSFTLTATAPGYAPFQTSFSIASGERKNIDVALTPIIRDDPREHEVPRPVTPTRTGPGAGPWVLVGVGAASLIAGGVLYGMHVASLAPCTVVGDTAYCDTQQQVDAAAQSPTLHLAGTIATIAGATLATAGLLWFGIGTATAHANTPRATVGVGLQSAFVRVAF